MSMNAFQLDNIKKMKNSFISQLGLREGQGVECVFIFYTTQYHNNNNFNDINALDKKCSKT
jgi:hypothetical protein